jgi:cytochrome c biogenesis protein CcmG, thiol:disulfide interchange protein DsbE
VNRRPRVPAALLPAALALVAGCTSSASGEPDAAPASTAIADVDTALTACADQPDDPAATTDLAGIALPCFSGGTLDFDRAQGTPTVLNLWASWCGPCREELPVVQQLADAAGDRLRVVGVASKDGVPQSTSFAADAGVTFPSAFDGDGAAMTALGFAALPYTLFLAADGSIAHVEVGQVDSLAEFERLVGEHLGVQL